MHATVMQAEGFSADVIVPWRDLVRIGKDHFRERKNLAGNFSKWDSLSDMLEDTVVQAKFLKDVKHAWEEQDFDPLSFNIDYEEWVGWSSTDRLEHYPKDALEEFNPNKRSVALRVKPALTQFLAPQTSRITFIYRLQLLEVTPRLFLFSVYPGEDIGHKYQNVTEREGVIFFDWDHPGTLQTEKQKCT